MSITPSAAALHEAEDIAEGDAPGLRTRARRRKLGGNMSKQYPLWFYIPAGVLFIVLFIVPTLLSFYFSLTRWSLFDIEFIGFANYVQFFREPALVKGFTNTFIFGFVTSALKVVFGLLIALLLTGRIIGRTFLRAVVFFPVLVSTIGVGITFKVLMDPFDGVINETLAVFGIQGPQWLTDPALALYSVAFVDVWRGVGLAALIFIAGIVAIPQEYFEAAKMDGATPGVASGTSRCRSLRPATINGDHPLADRGPPIVRPHLGDDPGRPRLQQRRDRLGDLQAVPGRILRALQRRKCHPVPRRDGDHRPDLLGPQPKAGRAVIAAVRRNVVGIIAIIVAVVVFIVPFSFILLTAMKPQQEASLLESSWPEQFALLREPDRGRLHARDFMLVWAFINSYDPHGRIGDAHGGLRRHGRMGAERRPSGLNPFINFMVLSGFIIPPAVVPTIWVLQGLELFGNLPGPNPHRGRIRPVVLHPDVSRVHLDDPPRTRCARRSIDELVHAPLLHRRVPAAQERHRHDHRRPGGVRLQRLPEPAVLPDRVELDGAVTLYNFQSQLSTACGTCCSPNILLITIPPLVMYIFFQKQIVAGMTSGAVKG